MKHVLARIVVVLSIELFLVLGLFIYLGYQSSVIGLAIQKQLGLAENLVANPSFEPPAATWGCGGEAAPNAWHCRIWQGNAALLWISNTNAAFSGTHYVLINGYDDSADAGWFTDPYFEVEDSEQYSFTGWIEAEYLLGSAQAYLSLKFYDDRDEYLGGSNSNAVLGSTGGRWVQVKGSVAPPDGAETARLEVRLKGAGNVRFDDVIVSDSPIVPFLVLGAGASPEPVSPTGTLTYVVTVSNTGGSPAHSICLTSTLDSRTVLQDWDTDQDSNYTQHGQVHVWCFDDALREEGGSLAVTLVVSVHVAADAHIPLSSTFKVGADYVEPISLTKKTLVDPRIDFEISPCAVGLAMPGLALDYVHTLTNTSNHPISLTTFSFEVQSNCGNARAYPENTGAISSRGTASVTMTFTPFTEQPRLPRKCLPTLMVEAPNTLKKITTCETLVISEPLGIDISGSDKPVRAGEELTYTLDYTYVGGMNIEGLRITVTLDGPAMISDSVPLPNTKIFTQTYVWSPTPEPTGGTGEILVVGSALSQATGFVTCTARIASRSSGPVTRWITSEIISLGSEVYLPVVIRNYPPPVVCNGGLEEGWRCWIHGGELSQVITSTNPHSGNFSALLGDPNYNCANGVPLGSAWMEQMVRVPSTASPRLVFYYNILTHDRNRSLTDKYDSFDVKINGPGVFRDMNTTDPYKCDHLRNLRWREKVIDLSDYQGLTITIRFENWSRYDHWYNTWTYVDDVRIDP